MAVVVVAAGLGVAGILAAAVAFAGGYTRGEGREAMSMYTVMVLMALFVVVLAMMASVGAFPEVLLGPNWLPATIVPTACIAAAVAIAVAFLLGMGRPVTGPQRLALVADCSTCLALAVLALGI